MSYRYSIHSDLDLVYSEFWGFVDANQVVMANNEILAELRHKPEMIEITDISSVTGTDVGFEEMSEHSGVTKNYYYSSGHTANHVIASSDLAYGLARVYVRLMQFKVPNLSVHIHRTEADALRAIGRPERTVQQLLWQDR